MKLRELFLVLALSACSSSAKHESHGSFVLPPPVALPSFDIGRGTKIAQQGTTTGAGACMGCHGANGEGVAAGGFPRLAGQPQMYLAAQLQAYRNGTRENAVMNAIAKALSDQDMQDVAAYYESISGTPYVHAAVLSGKRAKRAVQLTTWGDQKLGLQSCQNCHGPGGMGEGPSIPYLRGQVTSYLSAQLKAWKSGTRKSNPEHMGYISKLLPDSDIEILAAYYNQVPSTETKSGQK